jgi:predicted AAA+ superfamily ATPase
MYISRRIEHALSNALKSFPAVLITGPRQAGKSTLLMHKLKEYRYISFDDPILRKAAAEDPELFLTDNPGPLIIDEIQYVPELFSHLKLRIDKNRQSYGQYVLTGSQTFQLMKGISESLAGRIAIFQLYPFCWSEISSQETMSLPQQMLQGFYPEFFINKHLLANRWFGSYLNTYIERDLRNIKAISDLGRFQTYIQLLAYRSGQLLNLSEVAKECGISQTTAKDWLTVLESTYIVYILRPYFTNHTKRLVKSPKIYFVDTGLLCYLLGLDSAEQLQKSPFRGHVFENMVILDFVKTFAYDAARTNFYFYRTANGVEVDLLIERGGELFAFEIKYSQSPSSDAIQPLKLFMKEYKVKKGALINLRETPLALSQEIESIDWKKAFPQYFS